MSPIKGLSEQRRLPRLGKIRTGIKKKNEETGKEYPAQVPYFVLPAQLKEYFPEKPTELPIMIPVEDDEIWCNQYYKCYSSFRGLTCKGDGEECLRMLDKATGDKANRNSEEVVWKKMGCEGKACPDYQMEDCKECMNLQFIMPDFPGLGIWQIDTSSIHSIRNINDAARLMRSAYGRIALIPLILSLEPLEITTKKGIKKKVHVLNLRYRGTMRELMQASKQSFAELMAPPPSDDEAPLDFEDLHDSEAPEGKESGVTIENYPCGVNPWGGHPEQDKSQSEASVSQSETTVSQAAGQKDVQWGDLGRTKEEIAASEALASEKGRRRKAPAGAQKEDKMSQNVPAGPQTLQTFKTEPSSLTNIGKLYEAAVRDWPERFRYKIDILNALGKTESEIFDPAEEYLRLAGIKVPEKKP